MRRIQVVIIALILFIVGGLFISFLEKITLSYRWEESRNKLRSLIISMSSYKDNYKRFPAPFNCNQDRNPLLSWRLLTMPFLESNDLFIKFNLKEPWNSPNNLPLVNPPGYDLGFYDATGGYAEKGMAHYQVFVGPGTAFEPKFPAKINPPYLRGLSADEFPDGLENTMFIVEAREPVPWTKPQDLAYSPEKPIPPIGLQYMKNSPLGTYSYKSPSFQAAFGNVDVRSFSVDMDETVLRKLINRNDGE